MSQKSNNIVAVQRSDIALNVELANALVAHIFSGKPIYPREGYLVLQLPDGQEQELPVGTLNSWITRNSVIPSTTQTLRDVISKAREEYRVEKRRTNHRVIVDTAEKEIGRTLKLRTSQLQRNMFGQLVKNPDGSYARKENSNLLRIKMDTVKYVTERLDPDNYGKVDKTENKHLVFSLADLRKERQKQNEEAQQNTQPT